MRSRGVLHEWEQTDESDGVAAAAAARGLSGRLSTFLPP